MWFVNSNNKLPRPVRVYKTSGTLFLTILCKSCTSTGVWVGVLLTKQRQNLLPSGQNCRWRKRGERKQGNSIGRWENRDNKQRDCRSKESATKSLSSLPKLNFMKAFEHFFHVVLFIMLYKVVLTCESVDETLVCDHSNESYWAVVSCGTVYYAAQGGSKF